MARSYPKIMFTEPVRQLQQQHGSRASYARFEQGEVAPVELSELEAAFISQRDSFYLATVSETGWPYLQHRGGPTGFLRVLGPATLGFADFRGNRQYLSVGNLQGNDRVSLLLMDYPNRRRLKLIGHARCIDSSSEPELLAQLALPDYRAQVERGILIEIAGFDWNCPQHITPRYSEAEWLERMADF